MSDHLPRVHVVLATHEPQPDWLREQVASILAQQDVDVSLELVDDGSGADTLTLLDELCGSDPRCRWTSGPRVGSAANFGRGLGRAPRDVDALLLADQDDVWDSDKARALLALLDEGHLLVHSDARLIDAAGGPLPGTLFSHEQRDHDATSQAALLVRNVVTGCTVALRPRLLDAALPFPSVVGGPVHHDLWLALCAAGVGTIGTIERPLVSYRQHGTNIVGAVSDYGRFRGLRDAVGSWALRRRIALALVDVTAAGRLPPPDPDVTAWTGRGAEVASRRVLRRLGKEHPGMRPLVVTLRAGALGHRARSLVRAPLTKGRRIARIGWRGLRLLGFIARNPKRMLGGIARSAGVVDRPLRTVSATPHDPQQRPLRARVAGAGRTVHLLIPGVSPSGVFGGVGTAVALGVALAEAGERVQLVMTDYGQSIDDRTVRELILRHLDTSAEVLGRIGIARAIHDDVEHPLGTDDVFIATAWWTAHRAAATVAAHPDLRRRSIVYLIQDDETLFYEASERQLMAAASYGIDAVHVVNSRPLAEHLRSEHGLTIDDELVLAPRVAVPRTLPLRRVEGTLRVIVYGRPSVGRNLFHTALRGVAMWDAARRSGGDADSLEVISVGEPEQFRYRIGEQLVRTPGVLGWDDYLGLLATAHLGVSLMASPHPSYPPLEMAASGLVVVTNRWGPKDLGTLSERFVSCDPDATDVARALTDAATRHRDGGDPPLDLTPLGRPLDAVATALRERILRH
jgi:glycosyltransferase involved in cell wall biosynthesis